MNEDTTTAASATEASNGAATATAEGDLAAQLAAAQAEAKANYDKFLYAMADFENYKKRIERQLADIALAGKKNVLTKMLPVVDNLERALRFQDSEGLRDGLEATLRGFESALASEGVRAHSLAGKPFDPRYAEAIGTQPAGDDVPDESVVAEAQKAYVMGDDVLRVGQVIVAKRDAE